MTTYNGLYDMFMSIMQPHNIEGWSLDEFNNVSHTCGIKFHQTGTFYFDNYRIDFQEDQKRDLTVCIRQIQRQIEEKKLQPQVELLRNRIYEFKKEIENETSKPTSGTSQNGSLFR